MPARTHGGIETWRCDACGAYTDEPLQICSECQAKRLEGPSLSISKKAKGKTARKGIGIKAKKPRNKLSRVKDAQSSLSKEASEDMHSQLIEPTASEIEAAPAFQSEPVLEPEEGHELYPAIQDSLLAETPSDFASPSREAETDTLGGIPTDSRSESQERVVVQMKQNSESSLGNQFTLLYVNTPVPELIKRKIEIDLDSFPEITIGRSPENVIVIPDAGVSRVHAELRRENDRVIIRDLQSSNGTYVYDGKEFQRVEAEVEVTPNSLVKLGTGTILRFVSE